MKKSFRAGGARSGGATQALTTVRPAVEAVMLAAVAFGCAHAGWSLVAPPAQGAIDTGSAEGAWSAHPGETPPAAALVSPFAPDAAAGSVVSSAASTIASTVKVVSVRVSDIEARSGAIIAMQDGVERAFLVGQTLSDGVVLSEVNERGVVLSFAGGQREVSLAPATRHSFAAALLGRIDPPQEMALVVAEAGAAPSSALSTLTAVDAVASPFMHADEAPRAPTISVAPNVASISPDGALSASTSPEILAYLGALLARAPGGRIPASGLHLDGPLPAGIAAFGLREGDAIVAVNGADRIDLGLLSAGDASQGIALTVQRGSSAPVVLRAALRSPA